MADRQDGNKYENDPSNGIKMDINSIVQMFSTFLAVTHYTYDISPVPCR